MGEPSLKDGEGRIITFYSYKGGVGRSMALANVAFIAAMNGQRVLMMDWDLEAPGLGHYFRGLVEPHDARALKAAPGILNVIWEWIEKVRSSDDTEDLLNFVAGFESGAVFEGLVRPLLGNDFEESAGCLDFLRAGSAQIGSGHTYEEALSIVSWPQFFAADAGGVLLSSLRRWAKAKYDLVLIDSRTGLADVAGICTMQLPDEVALCFVLNRQNMEGVAQVAGAIRAKRAEEVGLRVVPMRLASRGTSEEASARARARREFTTIGGFAGDTVDEDFRLLAIDAAPNVPFYEALAPVMASDPLTDPLSQNYLRVASELVGHNFEMPILYDSWVERIRRRLQPKHATSDYLLELRASAPERAFLEVTHLVESALDAQFEHDAELDDEYVEALARAAISVADEADGPYESVEMLNQTLDLLRARSIEVGGNWRPIIVDTLTKLLEYSGFIDHEDELNLLDEIESLLVMDPTIATRLVRLRYRRRAARIHINEGEYEAVFQSISDIQSLIESLERNTLSPDQALARIAAEIDTFILRGDVYVTDSPDRAAAEFRRGYAMTEVGDRNEGRSEVLRLRLDLAIRLAIRLKEQIALSERAEFALEAARLGAAQAYSGVLFPELAQPILELGKPLMVVQFVQAMFRQERVSLFANSQARVARSAGAYYATAANLVEALGSEQIPGWEEAARDIGKASALVARHHIRRRATMSHRSMEESIVSSMQRLIEVLSTYNVADGRLELEEAVDALGRSSPPQRRRPSTSDDLF